MVYIWFLSVVRDMANRNSLTDLNKLLEEYGTDCSEAVRKITTQVAKEGAEALRTLKFAEQPTYKIRTGDYNKGWSVKKKKMKNRMVNKIYNKTNHDLTIYLENGHMKRNGTGRTRAFKHIEPTEKWVEAELEKRIEEFFNKL